LDFASDGNSSDWFSTGTFTSPFLHRSNYGEHSRINIIQVMQRQENRNYLPWLAALHMPISQLLQVLCKLLGYQNLQARPTYIIHRNYPTTSHDNCANKSSVYIFECFLLFSILGPQPRAKSFARSWCCEWTFQQLFLNNNNFPCQEKN